MKYMSVIFLLLACSTDTTQFKGYSQTICNETELLRQQNQDFRAIINTLVVEIHRVQEECGDRCQPSSEQVNDVMRDQL